MLCYSKLKHKYKINPTMICSKIGYVWLIHHNKYAYQKHSLSKKVMVYKT